MQQQLILKDLAKKAQAASYIKMKRWEDSKILNFSLYHELKEHRPKQPWTPERDEYGGLSKCFVERMHTGSFSTNYLTLEETSCCASASCTSHIPSKSEREKSVDGETHVCGSHLSLFFWRRDGMEESFCWRTQLLKCSPNRHYCILLVSLSNQMFNNYKEFPPRLLLLLWERHTIKCAEENVL